MAAEKNQEFWKFALDFYGIQGAQAALLALQDEHNGDVMAALWALAATSVGRRIDTRDCAGYRKATACAAAHAAGLRAARIKLKPGPAAAYEKAKADELAAERAVAAAAPDPFAAGTVAPHPNAAADLAAANLAALFDALQPPPPASLRLGLANMLAAKKA